MRTKRSAAFHSRIQGPRTGWRVQAGRIAMLACVFATTFLLTLGLGEAWAREDARPSIRLLGSGSHMSLLITSGNARVLIACGDDATAFGNALGSALHLTNRRIDVVILVGNDDDIPVARYARKNIDAKRVFALDGPLVRHLGDLGIEHDQVIAKSTRLRLPGGLDVTITPVSVADGEWSAVIEHGQTSVVASNSAAMDDLDTTGVSVAIVIGELKLATLAELDVTAVALPAKAARPSELKSAVDDSGADLFAIRVEPASNETLTFVTGGIQINGNAIRLGSGASS